MANRLSVLGVLLCWMAMWAPVVCGGKDSGWMYAMAMRGKPLHGSNFKGFKAYNHRAPKGGHLRLANIGVFFETLNPFLAGVNAAPGVGIGHYLPFDKLMGRSPDEPYTLYPRLARAVKVAEDLSWVMFELDPRAKFADGTPVLAEDVKATFDTLAQKGTPGQRLYASRIKSIEILAPRIVKITFNPVAGRGYDREAPFVVAQRVVLSKADLEKHPFGEDPWHLPLASGPYRVKHFTPGQAITFERRTDYWGWDLPAIRGFYNFDLITYTTFASDTVAFEALKVGEIDWWMEPQAKRWLKGYDFPALKRGSVAREEVPFFDAAIVTFMVYNTQRTPLNDRRVRLALSSLCDLDGLNKRLQDSAWNLTDSHFSPLPFAASAEIKPSETRALQNLGVDISDVVYAPLPALSEWVTPSQKPRIARAHQLLKEAGWTYHNGAVRDANGRPLSVRFLLVDPRFEVLVLAIKRWFAQAGIELRVEMVDAARYQRYLQKRDYDMIITSYGTTLSPGAEQQHYYVSAFADIPSRNLAALKVPAIDAICDRMLRTQTSEQQAFWCRLLDRTLRAIHPMRPLFYQRTKKFAYWRHLRHPPLGEFAFPTTDAWWAHAPAPLEAANVAALQR